MPIELTEEKTCPECHGDGRIIKTLGVRCIKCWGEGRTVHRHCPNCDQDFELFIPQPCPTCGRDFNDEALYLEGD